MNLLTVSDEEFAIVKHNWLNNKPVPESSKEKMLTVSQMSEIVARQPSNVRRWCRIGPLQDVAIRLGMATRPWLVSVENFYDKRAAIHNIRSGPHGS